MAQQPDEQSSPGKKKQGAEQTQAAEAKPGANAAKPHETAVKERGAMKESDEGPGAMKRRRSPERRMSRVREKAGRAIIKNLRPPKARKAMFPVNRPLVQRPGRSIRQSSIGKG